MSHYGKLINLHLMDGSAQGRWEARLDNWSGIAYKIPHKDLKISEDLDYITTPGVYFLFGRDDQTNKPFIYVGEAENVLSRLAQSHTFDKDGDYYWTEAIVFTTQDNTLEKGRIKYLEHRFYILARDAGRYIVMNRNTPPQSSLPPYIRDSLEAFLRNAKILMPTLGYDPFTPLHSTKAEDGDNDDLLYFSRSNDEGGRATGKINHDGFWVLKGSYINPELKSYAGPGVIKAREEYASFINKDSILTEDICFGSPSYASSFVCGKSSNGRTDWKNKDGVTLAELTENNPIQAEKAVQEVSISRENTLQGYAYAHSNRRPTYNLTPDDSNLGDKTNEELCDWPKNETQQQIKETFGCSTSQENLEVLPSNSIAIKNSSSNASSIQASETLYLTRNGGKSGEATGHLDEQGFWVHRGSYVYPLVSPYADAWVHNLREKHAEKINLLNSTKEDLCFRSPSAAAAFVFGKNSSGPKEWKNAAGISLKDLQNDTLSTGATLDIEECSSFSEAKETSAEETLLYIKNSYVSARAQLQGDGLLVLTGSQMRAEEVSSCRKTIKTRRQKLISNGKVVDYIFVQDVFFDSASGAASLIMGGDRNGLDEWRLEDGTKLKELLDKNKI